MVVTRARDDDGAATAAKEADGRGGDTTLGLAIATAARREVARRDAPDSILVLDESINDVFVFLWPH